MVKVDGRSVLKQGQIDILELLYKYRFGSRQLIADSLNIKAGSSLHEKLDVLIKHGYINKRLDKAQKLYGMPVAYFLTPKGLKFMQSLPNHEYITESVIKSSYRDKSTSLGFITHTLDAYRLITALKRKYPGLKAFTRREMSKYSYFPTMLPDAFLSIKVNDQPKRFFFDLVPDLNMRRILDVRLTNYADFFDRGGWDITDSELPCLLLVADKGSAERRLQRVTRVLRNKYDIDSDIFTSTITAITSPNSECAVWSDINDPDELQSLQ